MTRHEYNWFLPLLKYSIAEGKRYHGIMYKTSHDACGHFYWDGDNHCQYINKYIYIIYIYIFKNTYIV